jgi:hypothetical protein
LNPDERQRIKAKDIFSHPWVKGFEPESLKNPKSADVQTPQKKLLTQQSIKKLSELKSQPTEKTKPQQPNQTNNKTDNKTPTKNIQNDKDKTPLKNNILTSSISNLDINKTLEQKLSNKKIDTYLQNVPVNQSNDKINELKNKINLTKQKSIKDLENNSELNEFSLLSNANTSMNNNQNNFFTDVLNKVVKKNEKGAKGLSRNIPDVEGLLRQDTMNKSMNRTIALDESISHDFSLIMEKNEIERKLQEQQDKIMRNQNKIFKARNDISNQDTFNCEYKIHDDFEDDIQAPVHKIKREYAKSKNTGNTNTNVINLNTSYQASTVAGTQKPSVMNSDGYYNDDIFFENHLRGTNRRASLKRSTKGKMSKAISTRSLKE